MNEFYQARRAALLLSLSSKGAAVVSGNREVHRNGNVFFPFRQSSDLLYLTGWKEPDAVAVFTPFRRHSFTLFVRNQGEKEERYHGHRKGCKEAVLEYGADQSFPIETLSEKIKDLLDGFEEVSISIGHRSDIDAMVLKTITDLRNQERSGRQAPWKIIDLQKTLSEQRLKKDDAAIQCLRKAMEITKEGHLCAMQSANGGEMTEEELGGLVDFTFRKHGGTSGYPSIVASGNHANILHHAPKMSALSGGELVLIDAGCEWEGFTADVSRTFPIRKHWNQPALFSKEQKKVYDWVLKAQLAGIKRARPGSTLQDIYHACRQVLVEGMIDLGLLQGNPKLIIEEGTYKRFSPHLFSHWLGLDVHDVGEYFQQGKNRTLSDGMVFTIEPGMYIPMDEDIPKHYRGIGIRIEDNILITSKNPEGHEVLSASIPKTTEEIETLLNAHLTTMDL